MLTLAKNKIVALSVASMCLIPLVHADDSMVATFGITKSNSEWTFPDAQNKTKGYTTMATLSKELYQGWIGTAILGISDYDTNTYSSTKDSDVNTLGIAASKHIGIGRDVSLAAIYSHFSLDDAIASNSTSGHSWILSAGVTQNILTLSNGYTTLGATLTYVANSIGGFNDTVNNTSLDNSSYDYTYVSLSAKHTWIINSYQPYASLEYNRADDEFTKGVSDKDYYRWGTGISKEFSADTSVVVSFSKVFGKDYASSDNLGVMLVKKF